MHQVINKKEIEEKVSELNSLAYISRYIDLLNTIFSNTHMITTLDSIAGVIEPEMPRHFIKWGGNLTQWLNNVQKVRNFINTRCNYISNGLKSCYNLTGPYPVVVEEGPVGKGSVKFNSLVLNQFRIIGAAGEPSTTTPCGGGSRWAR